MAAGQQQARITDIIPSGGSEIENGVLIVQNGVITGIGEAGELDIPDNADITDVSGKVIMPGLVVITDGRMVNR